MEDQFVVSSVSFVVSDFEVAEKLFSGIMELDLIIKSENVARFWLGENTILECWMNGHGPGKDASNRNLALVASNEVVLGVAEKLKKMGWDGDIMLDSKKSKDGGKWYLLQISTPKVLSHLSLTSKGWPSVKNYSEKIGKN